MKRTSFGGVLVLKGLVGLLSNLLKEEGQIILEVEVFYKLITNCKRRDKSL